MYFPLLNHSHYSLLLSCQSVEDIVAKCKENEYKACGLTDFTSIAGCVFFYKACKKAGIKPILGCEVNTGEGTLTLLCRNLKGWKELIQIVTLSNSKDNFKEYATLSIEQLQPLFSDNLIIVDGYYNSILCNKLFKNDDCYLETDYETLKNTHLRDDWARILQEHIDMFVGKRYFVSVFNNDANTVPISKLLSNCIWEQTHNISNLQDRIIDNNQTYYPNTEDAVDQRVLLASKLKTTMRKLESSVKQKKYLNKFLNSSSYYIFDIDQVEELGLSDMERLYRDIEEFDILSPPKFPKFAENEDELLTEMCRKGWREKLKNLNDIQKPIYTERIKTELSVIKGAKLSGYFLIVQDFINHFREKGELINIRGSAGGCLISYLIGISDVNPVEYQLSFARFYNSGRNTGTHISMPDIDTDFPPDIREEVIQYIKDKYGKENVCQICTFGRLQGASALKEVLRVNELCSPTEMDIITEKFPTESSISDLLEEMEDKSIILWSLENMVDEFKDYCWLENGEFKGQYGKAFEQAKRLEGSLKTQGKHAAGVVIANEPINNFCPMVKGSRSSELLAGFEMKSLEAVGGLKYDILGVAVLGKIRDTLKDWDELR